MIHFEINSAAFNDLNDILLLQKQAFMSEVDIYNDFKISPPLLQSLEEIIKEFSEQLFLKAIIRDQIIGSVRGFQKGPTVYIKRLFVSPHFQNQGIGTKLMKSLENSFKNTKRYELFTGHKSLKNLYLYNKLGYKEFKRIPVHENLTMIYLEKFAK